MMKGKRRVLITWFAAVCIVLTSIVANAGSYTAGSVYVEGKGGVYGSTNPNIDIAYSYGAELGYFLADDFAVGVELMGYYFEQQKRIPTVFGTDVRFSPVSALGPALTGRWYFAHSDAGAVYIGAGLGGLFGDGKVPYNGYYTSLTEHAELGFSVNMTEGLDLKGAGRYMHVGEFDGTGADLFGGNLGLNYSF
ncbi:hypothetical protein [Desulfovibrio inopinatus]|uniref:hypothetical protein n=1 Tax=Desulfovibrio inopinatus TaxID=102109 RepID=UPI0004002252|nr:hypothetical protein [Desulfovibrio inopinatus]